MLGLKQLCFNILCKKEEAEFSSLHLYENARNKYSLSGKMATLPRGEKKAFMLLAVLSNYESDGIIHTVVN